MLDSTYIGRIDCERIFTSLFDNYAVQKL